MSSGRVVYIPYKPRPYQLETHRALRNYRFSCHVWHRRAGKSVAFVNELIAQAAKCRLPRPRYSYIAPLYTQAKQIAWDYLKHFTKPIPGVKVNESELWVMLPNEARIKLYGADNPDSLRGVYHDGVVLDEPADMKLAEVWGEVVRPALADRGGWAAFVGTPRGLDPFYDIYQLALHDPMWYASHYTVHDTMILPQDELDSALREMGETRYAQEFMCDFTASSEDIMIPLSIVQPALGHYHDVSQYAGAPIILSYDIARFGDDETVGFKRQGLAAWEIRRAKGLDTMTVVGLIAHDINEHNPDAVFIDEGNMGAGVIDRLRQLGYTIIAVLGGGAATRHPALYLNKRAEMWGEMKQWLKDGGAIPDDALLASQLSGPTYKFNNADKLVLEKKEDMKKRGLKSPDRAEALAQTFSFPVKKRKETNIIVQKAQDARAASSRRRAQTYSVLDHR